MIQNTGLISSTKAIYDLISKATIEVDGKVKEKEFFVKDLIENRIVIMIELGENDIGKINNFTVYDKDNNIFYKSDNEIVKDSNTGFMIGFTLRVERNHRNSNKWDYEEIKEVFERRE